MGNIGYKSILNKGQFIFTIKKQTPRKSTSEGLKGIRFYSCLLGSHLPSTPNT